MQTSDCEWKKKTWAQNDNGTTVDNSGTTAGKCLLFDNCWHSEPFTVSGRSWLLNYQL